MRAPCRIPLLLHRMMAVWTFGTCTTVLRLGAASVARIRWRWHGIGGSLRNEELDIDADDGGVELSSMSRAASIT